MLHCEYRYEQGLRECYRGMEESLAWAALNAGRDVIVDRTHLAAEARRRWLRWAREVYDSLNTFDGRGPRTTVVAVAFPVEAPEVHARRRFEADPRGRSHEEWYMVAQHHFAQHLAEPLSESEGFAEIIRMGANR
jgi:predicted kinase